MKQILQSFSLGPINGISGVPKLRFAADGQFSASTGEVHLDGNDKENYTEIALTQNGDEWVFPDTELDTTDDSSDPNASYTLYLLDGRNKLLRTIFERWAFTASWGSSVGYGQAEAFNVNRVPLRDDQAYSKRQSDGLYTSLLAPDASQLVKGKVRLSIAAVNPADPEALGSNDSRVVEEISLSKYSSLSAAATAAGTTKQLVIDIATAPASNLDLSGSVLRFARGGAINPTTGITVTLGVFTAPRVQIFGGAGNIRFSGQSLPVFYPEWWGVKGDAYTANDGAITAASAAFSSASHPSTSVDVNKNVILYGAGTLSGTSGLNNALRTTVSSVPGGNYTLAATATATVSGAYFAMGTSNTTAMQKCFDSLPSFSMVHFAPGKYMLGSTTVPSGCYLYASRATVTIFSTSNSVFVTSGKNDVTIDGLTVDASGNISSGGSVALLGGTAMNNLVVQNCTLTDTFLTGNVAPVATFNRHGILARSYDTLSIHDCKFYNGMRIKAHGGAGNALNADIHDNYFSNMNENGVSLLDSSATGIARNVRVHDNIFEGIMSSGNCIVIGDDGFSLTISNGSNAAAAVITTTTAHNLTTGWLLYFYDFAGGWTSLNGNVYTVTVLTSTTFSIPVDSTGFGAFAGASGGHAHLAATQEQSDISIVNNTFRGPLLSNTNFIQNRGNYIQKNIKISYNTFDNLNGSPSATTNMAINNAAQIVSGQPIINFEATGNVAIGYYDFAALRMSLIGSGIIMGNQVYRNDNAGVGLRMGSLSNVLVANNLTVGLLFGIYLMDGTVDNVTVKDNTVEIADAVSAIGIYIAAMTSAITSLSINRNRIKGSGVANNNNYGIQDANNNNGKSDVVKYIGNDITDVLGTGSFNYRTLPTGAAVVDALATPPTTLSDAADRTTPSVQGKQVAFVNNGAGITITNLLNGYVGQMLTLLFTNGNTTIQNNANIKLVGGVNFVGSADDTLTLTKSTSAWLENSRSVL
jgi:hypothetical protein